LTARAKGPQLVPADVSVPDEAGVVAFRLYAGLIARGKKS
jgi:hypothetical protein